MNQRQGQGQQQGQRGGSRGQFGNQAMQRGQSNHNQYNSSQPDRWDHQGSQLREPDYRTSSDNQGMLDGRSQWQSSQRDEGRYGNGRQFSQWDEDGSQYGRSPREMSDGQRGYGMPNYGGADDWQSQGQQRGYMGQGQGGQSWSSQGQDQGHRGKGPKGYKRSDDRVKETVCDCLTDHSGIDASDIDVQVKEGEVTLTGTVADRETKRRAEQAIENLAGVNDVVNQIRVKREDQQGKGNGGSMTSDRQRNEGRSSYDAKL